MTKPGIATARRDLLRVGTGSLFATLAARLAAPRVARAAATTAPGARADALIVLWLNGGPSHIDTFDPKPGSAGAGPHKAIKTATPGVLLSEHLPALAAASGKLAFVRGMSTKEGNHQRAHYLLHTGYSPNPTVAHPSLGAWVSKKSGAPATGLPAFVSIGGPSLGGGFLGAEQGPFVLQKAGAAPPNLERSATVDEARFSRRQAALASVEARFAAETGDPKVEGHQALYGKAFRMMESPEARAFDLSSEPAASRAAYGETDFGRGCLVARRLVEAGVRCVEVVLDGWDTHQNNFERTRALMTMLDAAMAALVHDLDTRGRLARTAIVCMGEFGRTPTINGNDGRDHYPRAWSAVLAGGGIRGGIVHGETDGTGANVVKDAVSVPDLLATLATTLGMSPSETHLSPIGRPISLTDSGVPIAALLT